MNIPFDKRTFITATVIALLAGIIGGMAYANHGSEGFMRMHHNTSTMNDDQSTRGSMSGSDAMFFQMMIPHHQQAVDISNLAIATSHNSELVALAHAIADGQSKEIVQMKTWLNAAGYSTDVSDHMGHDMGGMLSDSELAALKDATGTDFDRLWLIGMIGHHEGALHMVQMIDSSTNSDTNKFGSDIEHLQTAQITQMRALLKSMN